MSRPPQQWGRSMTISVDFVSSRTKNTAAPTSPSSNSTTICPPSRNRRSASLSSQSSNRPVPFLGKLGPRSRPTSRAGSSESDSDSDSDTDSDSDSSHSPSVLNPSPRTLSVVDKIASVYDAPISPRIQSNMQPDDMKTTMSFLRKNSLTTAEEFNKIIEERPKLLNRQPTLEPVSPMTPPDSPLATTTLQRSTTAPVRRTVFSPSPSPSPAPAPRVRPPFVRAATIETDNVSTVKTTYGHRKVNQYAVMKKLGSGASAQVKLVLDTRTKSYYAMKVMSKYKLQKEAMNRSESDWQNFKRETAIMKKLSHPNIVKLVEVIDDPETDRLYMIMELVELGTLWSAGATSGHPYPELLARKYFRDLLSGLEYLHAQSIMHRDIKPENLLVSKDYVLKIADFGVSMEFRSADDDSVSHTAGTTYFMPPEMCRTDQGSMQFSGRSADIWACGVTLYALIYGKLPFTGFNSMAVIEAIRDYVNPLELPTDPSISDGLRHLFSQILEKDPAKRIQMAELKEHPWITNNGVEPMPELGVIAPGEVKVDQSEVDNAWVVLVKIKQAFRRKVKGMRERKQRETDQANADADTYMDTIPDEYADRDYDHDDDDDDDEEPDVDSGLMPSSTRANGGCRRTIPRSTLTKGNDFLAQAMQQIQLQSDQNSSENAT
jgi:tRNA A-37 threonylcarbamoyl transferase component Bud32